MVSGLLDVLHPPHHRRMAKHAPTGIRGRVLFADHMYLCAAVGSLRLWERPDYWAPPCVPRPLRAAL